MLNCSICTNGSVTNMRMPTVLEMPHVFIDDTDDTRKEYPTFFDALVAYGVKRGIENLDPDDMEGELWDSYMDEDDVFIEEVKVGY